MERCAYCGILARREDLTRDHVLPRNMYPAANRARVNLLTVPSCERCNGGISDDEVTFRNVMLLAGDPNPAVRERWDNAQRSFDECDGRKRVTELSRMLVPVTVNGQERKMIFPARIPAVLRVVRKVVRGLAHYHDIGTAIPEERVSVDVLRYPIVPELIESATFHHRDPEIFEYWFQEISEDEISSIWLLKFFEKRTFVASIAA